MPQIMVDTDTESPVSLRMLADLLTSYARMKEAVEAQDSRTVTALAAATEFKAPPVDTNRQMETYVAALAAHQHNPPISPGMTVTGPGIPEGLKVVGPLDLPQGDETTQVFNPAEIFAKVPTGTVVPVAPTGPTLPGNVLPFPGAPSFPVIPLTADTAAQTLAPNLTQQGVTTAAGAGTVASVELDSAGIPWDARIHQDSKGRNEKGKGTWKVKKGLEQKNPGLLEQVMAELTAKKLGAVPAVAPPVTLPPTMPMLQPPAMGPAGGPLVLPTMSLASPGASLQPLPSGLPPANPPTPNVGIPANPMMQFQALMQKIGAALNATPPLITQEQVNAAHTNLGVPQLQLLITQPDKIPQVEAALGL